MWVTSETSSKKEYDIDPEMLRVEVKRADGIFCYMVLGEVYSNHLDVALALFDTPEEAFAWIDELKERAQEDDF